MFGGWRVASAAKSLIEFTSYLSLRLLDFNTIPYHQLTHVLRVGHEINLH